MNKKTISILTAIVMVLSLGLLSGCGKGISTVGDSKATDSPLTFWCTLNPNLTNLATDFGDTDIAKEWIKQTGVDVKFIHPTSPDQFNLMMASNDLPDIIETNWLSFLGGPGKALADKQILNLTDMFAKDAPNLSKYLKEHPDVDKDVKTDDGKYYMFPFVRGDEMLLTSTGPIVRKDWLEQLNLAIPETIDDWTIMLTRFKKEKGAQTPLVMTNYKSMMNYGAFCGAYGVSRGLFIDDAGKVAYGAISDGYKQTLMLLNQWYKEGLLDNNFMATEAKVVDSSMLNGKAGATVGALGGGIGKWMAATTEPGYEVIGAKYPSLKKGEKVGFSSRQNTVSGAGAAITTKSKNVAAAIKFLDYSYSEQGHMLQNFGILGVSYTMESGYPKYTELITKNPNGTPMANIMSKYVRSNMLGAFVQDKRYIEQYAALPQQQETLKNWMDTTAKDHILPPITPTQEESSEITKLFLDIETYSDEVTLKMIIGETSFDQWDAYVTNVKNMGLDKVLDINEQALMRYKNRK